MTIHSVWFWAPMHMLQAYPMTRVLPLPDFIIPFAHLLWVPLYIAEHWAGLADPVVTAFTFSESYAIPFSALILFSFWYFCHKQSNNKTLVKIMIVLYFGFLAMSVNGWFGFIGSPPKTYEDTIAANVDPKYNRHHTLLHVWYLATLWIATLTVPFEKLATGKAKNDTQSDDKSQYTYSSITNPEVNIESGMQD
mmetsp:Transcript_34692/g.51066  ORF Transcript_34692/g.51066 Transcript_34692/m.51066 type:complete len:194 (-) Transcript_34692:414-995(-)